MPSCGLKIRNQRMRMRPPPPADGAGMAEPSKLSQDTDRPPQPGGIVARALAARGERTYLAGLNPEQRLAVETLYGPVWCWPAPVPARRGC